MRGQHDAQHGVDRELRHCDLLARLLTCDANHIEGQKSQCNSHRRATAQ